MTDEAGTVETEDAVEAPERPLPENEVLRSLFERFEDVDWEDSLGQDVARVPNDRWLEFATAAKDGGFEVCVDVTAVDWMRQRPDRFEVVANLLSMQHRLRLRLITTAPRQEPTVASLVPVWPGANFPSGRPTTCSGSSSKGIPT